MSKKARTGNRADGCSKYWEHADYLPLHLIVKYWCEKTGYSDYRCMEAKEAAIIAQCEKGVINYSRSDGKDFYDPPQRLAARGALVVERESFDKWVTENFEPESPIPRPAVRDSSVLATMAALLAAWPAGAVPSAKDLERAAHSVGLSISDDTIRKVISAARRIAPDLPVPK